MLKIKVNNLDDALYNESFKNYEIAYDSYIDSKIDEQLYYKQERCSFSYCEDDLGPAQEDDGYLTVEYILQSMGVKFHG